MEGKPKGPKPNSGGHIPYKGPTSHLMVLHFKPLLNPAVPVPHKPVFRAPNPPAPWQPQWQFWEQASVRNDWEQAMFPNGTLLQIGLSCSSAAGGIHEQL